MTASNRNATVRPSAEACAEAAAWVARLHGPNRSREVEAAWRRWMAEDVERAAAFELLTDTWEKSARLRRRPMEQIARWQTPGLGVRLSRLALATCVMAILAITGTFLYLSAGVVGTGIGEQRTLTLEDGTRVYLNTDSQIQVHYNGHERRIDLKRGEALFEVAKRPKWPFTVNVGERQIRALGTAFLVRRHADDLAVTLVEGKVTVTPKSQISAGKAGTDLRKNASAHASNGGVAAVGVAMMDESTAIFTLEPGQRLTLSESRLPRIDMPPIENVTAWQRGQLPFDHTTLAEAVAEMNRYSQLRLVIEDPQAASIEISGIFRVGDTLDFAKAVGKTYGLRVLEEGNAIVLAGKPTLTQPRAKQMQIRGLEQVQVDD
jgi:transmembrane sensor